jgi:hypothetical protein
MKINMTIEQTTYTNLRENLAPHLRKILKNNTVLEVIWRSHEPCVMMPKKRYDQLLKSDLPVGHVNVDDSLDGHGHGHGHGQVRTSPSKASHGQKSIEKTPHSLIPDSQHDFFQ